MKHYSFNEVRDFFERRHILINYRDTSSGFKLNLDITVRLCDMAHSERSLIIEALQNKFVTDNRIIEQELLSFDELRKLDQRVVTIASHSLTHPSFKKETDPYFIEKELLDSKHIIEKELNAKAEIFAFPFTKWNDISLAYAKQLYAICFTKINDLISLKKIKTDKDYLYNLPRFNIHHDTAEEVFFLINGFHNKLYS